MSLKIEPLADIDVDEFTKTYWDAFEPLEADMIMPQIYPRGLTPDLIDRLRSRLSGKFGPDKENQCYVVKDPASGKIMGVSWWVLELDPPQTKDKIDAKFEEFQREWMSGREVEGMNKEMAAAAIRSAFFTEHEVVQGRPYMHLALLATHPKYHRRGVGSCLLDHGLQRADELDLPVYIDASIMGRPFYEGNGFTTKMTRDLDARDYGGRSAGTHWAMWKDSKSEREKADSK